MKDESKLRSEYVFENPEPQNPDADPLLQAGQGLRGERMDNYNEQLTARAERAEAVASHDDPTEQFMGSLAKAAGEFMSGNPIAAGVTALNEVAELNKPDEDSADPSISQAMGLPVYSGTHLHDRSFVPSTPVDAHDVYEQKNGRH